MAKIQYLGHACFIVSDKDKTLIIDPFLSNNPKAAKQPEQVKPDLILVTHGHFDHSGDAITISRTTGAPVYTTFELSTRLQAQGANVVGGNHGGTKDFGFAKVKICWASHSSSFGEKFEYAGNPCGFVITISGKTIYHAGDTDLFGDMKLIGERHNLDLALIPIGGFFTMDADDATVAVEYLKPKYVIPMHYNTWPQIEADPEYFKKKVEQRTSSKCIILSPGETFEI
jgi:L-ascorbate metabolism protein UlaG (beta-lactamase superfamily)